MANEALLWSQDSCPPGVGATQWGDGGSTPASVCLTLTPPPSMCASWCTIWLLGMLTVEGPEQLSVQDVATRDPRPLLLAVPLPIQQVLPTAASPANVQYLPDCVGGYSVHGPDCWGVVSRGG